MTVLILKGPSCEIGDDGTYLEVGSHVMMLWWGLLWGRMSCYVQHGTAYFWKVGPVKVNMTGLSLKWALM